MIMCKFYILLVAVLIGGAHSESDYLRRVNKWIRLPLPIPRPPARPGIANCPMGPGCVAGTGGSTVVCAANMCDISDPNPPATVVCHWPAATTGCLQVGTTPDCDCAPGPATPANCPVGPGCVAGTGGSTVVCAANMCDISDPNPPATVQCHWPAATTGCLQVGTTPDCDCAPM